jgi:lipopolysaccharide export system protein LptA
MTEARVEFRTPQATGWAVGVKYAGKSNMLTLSSQIHVVINGPDAAVIEADHGIITNDPREIVLDHPHLKRDGGTVQADQAVFHLGPENHVERILATGNVMTETERADAGGKDAADTRSDAAERRSEMRSRADQAEFRLAGKQDLLRTATMSGNVHIEETGPQPMQGDAGRLIMDFAGHNQLQRVHAIDGARLRQNATGGTGQTIRGSATDTQQFELTAPVIDFTVAQGHTLQRAVTSGAAKITVVQARQSSLGSAHAGPAQVGPAQSTVVTAGKFDAEFANDDRRNHLSSIHGAPEARIVNSTDGEPDRISTSDSIDASFLPQGGLDSITQRGNVVYTDGQGPDKRMQAWANAARYTPSDQMLVLSGAPRIANGGMATTAKTIRINRATGDAVAETDVKSTYSELKEQPDGALLASSSPIHVTARTMTARNNPGLAVYTGNARLWQDANVIEASSIQFDRDRRFVTAQGTPALPVRTILVQAEKNGSGKNGSGKTVGRGKENAKGVGKTTLGTGSTRNSSTAISITAMKLTYADSERRVHYEGGVVAKSADFTATAKTADAYLVPHSQTSNNQSFAGPGQLDRMIAHDDVTIQQPNRRADGQKLAYTAADDKFVLTGGPPSIFDAEQGKITGVSLTFFRGDDRVLVEGEGSTPVVTQTRVAR